MNRRSLTVLFIVLFLVMTGFSILFPVLPHFARHVGANETEWGWIVAAYSFMQFLFSPIWGGLSDRIGRKRVLLTGLAGYVATFLLLAYAQTLLQVLLVRAVSGALTSATLPTAMAYVGDNTTREERSKGMGVLGAAMGLGVIFGPMIGAFLSRISFSTPFLASAAVGAATFLLAVLFLKESRPAYTGPRPSRWSVVRGQMGVLNLVSFSVSMVISGFEATFALYILDRFAMGEMHQGYLFGLIGFAAALVQGMFIHRWSRRFGEEQVLRAGLIIITLGLVAVAAAWREPLLYALVPLYGIGMGTVRPMVATLVSKRAARQGIAIGAMDAMDSMGRVVGPVFATSLYGYLGPVSPYWSGAGITLLTLLTVVMVRTPAAEVAPAD